MCERFTKPEKYIKERISLKIARLLNHATTYDYFISILYNFRALDRLAYLRRWSSCPDVIVTYSLVFLTASPLVEQNINISCKVEPLDLGVSFSMRETVGKYLKR